MDANYKAQIVADILEAKEKTNWAPLILVEWKPRYSKDWRGKERPLGGIPNGYVLLTEPSCRQVELYGVLRRTMPQAVADQILARHIVKDRIGLDKIQAAGFTYSLVDALTRWSVNDPYKLNPMPTTGSRSWVAASA